MKNINKKSAILIICTGYFGDVLLTSKLARDIKKNYPENSLIFICDSPYVSVAQGLPGVDKVIPYNRKINSNPLKFLRFILDFPCRNRISHAFIIHQNKGSRRFLAKVLGAKRITAWEDFKYSEFQTKLLKENSKYENVAYFNANMLNVLTNNVTDDRDIEFMIPTEVQQKMDKFLLENKLQNLVAINPQAGDECKCWDVDEFIKFVKMLIKVGKTPVITGVSKDGNKYINALEGDDEIKSGEYLNFIDKTNFAQLAALYKRCLYVVSVDTGSAHLASAVGASVLVLFFNDIAHMWAPINTKQNSYIYKSTITAQEIMSQIDEKLQENEKPLLSVSF